VSHAKKTKLLSLSLLLLAAGSASAAPLGLAPRGSGVTVSGLTPHGRAVVFGITREADPEDDVPTIQSRAEVLSDDDGDGIVQDDLGRPLPLRSIWAAVDLATGAVDSAAPSGFPLRKVAWRGRGLTEEPGGGAAVEDQRPFAELLVVRPGAGAWTLRIGDGGPADADGAADGRLLAPFAAMTPLAGSPPPPQTFQDGDIVILLDPNTLEMTLAKVGTGLL
jgi:hypothetical protein